MARKPMVTRSMKTTKVTVLCMELVKCEPVTETVVLPRTYADDKKLMKAVETAINSEELKAVHITSKEEIETLYGMTEEDFIKNAVKLDAETRKVIEEETADEE